MKHKQVIYLLRYLYHRVNFENPRKIQGKFKENIEKIHGPFSEFCSMYIFLI